MNINQLDQTWWESKGMTKNGWQRPKNRNTVYDSPVCGININICRESNHQSMEIWMYVCLMVCSNMRAHKKIMYSYVRSELWEWQLALGHNKETYSGKTLVYLANLLCGIMWCRLLNQKSSRWLTPWKRIFLYFIADIRP